METLLEIPEWNNFINIDYLHLDSRTQNKLYRNQIFTLGDLISHEKPENNIGLGNTAKSRINQALGILARCIDHDEVNWDKYWGEKSITVINPDVSDDIRNQPLEILSLLPEISKEMTLSRFDEIHWITIERRYGITGKSQYTLEEIGEAFGVTRERIRQVEHETINFLRKVLFENSYRGETFRLAPDFYSKLQRFFESFLLIIRDGIRQDHLLDELRFSYRIDGDKFFFTLLFIAEIIQIEIVSFNRTDISSVWGFFDKPDRILLSEILVGINRILTIETPKALGDFDILLNLNKGRKDKFSLADVRRALPLCSTVEKTGNNKWWGKLEYLRSRTNQVERILIENNQELHLEQIVRLLNARLAGVDHHIIKRRTLVNQISADGRFINIGKSGYWGLAEWLSVEDANILELMERCLINLNEPASLEAIYEFVASKRPVELNSIKIYLSMYDTFVEIKRGLWGLSHWKEAKTAKAWTPDDVAKFVANVFRSEKTNELDYKFLKDKLKEETGFHDKRVQGLLNTNPVIKTSRIDYKTLVSRFQENYEEELQKVGRRFPSKKPTLLQQVEVDVLDMLRTQPGNQMPLNEIVSTLVGKHKRRDKTFYRYISLVESKGLIERFSPPGVRKTMVRLSEDEIQFEFPQIDLINNEPLKENVSRALSYFNDEEIDIGLFLLAKEFENVLKAFLREKQQGGRLVSDNLGKEPAEWKLATMVDVAKSNGFITDKSTFHYLRQNRNDRSHDPIPSKEERKLMFNAAQILGGLYIDSIVLFSNHEDEK